MQAAKSISESTRFLCKKRILQFKQTVWCDHTKKSMREFKRKVSNLNNSLFLAKEVKKSFIY